MEGWSTTQYEVDDGDISPMIAFINSPIGIPFETANGGVREDEPAERGEDYVEDTIPRSGLILTMGVDVQHDRLAVTIRTWGCSEESWPVWWSEIHGNAVDVKSDVWHKLTEMVSQTTYKHETGAGVKIAAVSVDNSGGNTFDAMYHFVYDYRGMKMMSAMAIKNSTNPDEETSNQARTINSKHKNTKADKFGIQIYSIDVSRAKDLLVNEHVYINSEGSRAGRIHFYKDAHTDYCGRLLSEVKVPSRMNRRKKIWQKKVDVRNETLDCKIYTLYAARSISMHAMSTVKWTLYGNALLQSELFTEPKPAEQIQEKTKVDGDSDFAITRRRKGDGFVTNYWFRPPEQTVVQPVKR